MASKRFTDEFKAEAVKQVSERGYPVTDVAARLGARLASNNLFKPSTLRGLGHNRIAPGGPKYGSASDGSRTGPNSLFKLTLLRGATQLRCWRTSVSGR